MNNYITVFTPTFNRASTLVGLYQSLIRQTYKNFEWIIVDDGSTDSTNKIVKKWVEERKIKIFYYYENNSGKHIAMNYAVAHASGYFFTTVDSDDILSDNALEILLKAWLEIPQENWHQFISVKAESYDLDTGERLGPLFHNSYIICNYLDAHYKYNINYEMQSLSRVDALKEFPNPDIRSGLRYYPENIWQDLAARKYLTKFIDATTCGYRRSSDQSLLGRGRKYDRYRENIYLWIHIINDNMDYFFYNPKEFLKAFIGISMDTIFNKYSFIKVLKELNTIPKRIISMIFYPFGLLAYEIKK